MSEVLNEIDANIISEQTSSVIRGERDVDAALFALQQNEEAIVQHVSLGKDLVKEYRIVLVKAVLSKLVVWIYGLLVNYLSKGNFTAQAAAFILKHGHSSSRLKAYHERLVTIMELKAFHTSQVNLCCKKAVTIKDNIQTLINHGHATKTETARKILDHMI